MLLHLIIIVLFTRKGKIGNKAIRFIYIILLLSWYNFKIIFGGWNSWVAMGDVIQIKVYGIESLAMVKSYNAATDRYSVNFNGFEKELYLDHKNVVNSTITVKYLENDPIGTIIQNDNTLTIFDLLHLRGLNHGQKNATAFNFSFPIFIDLILLLLLFRGYIITSQATKYWMNEARNNPHDYSPENIKRMESGKCPIIPEFEGLNKRAFLGGDLITKFLFKNNKQQTYWPWEFNEIDPFDYYSKERSTRMLGSLDEKIGEIRLYNENFKGRKDILLWDIMEIMSEQFIKITFIQNNSIYRQGIRLAIDSGEGKIEINGRSSRAIQLWADTAQKEFICKCKSEKGLLSIYNIFDKGTGRMSLGYTSGMLMEEVDEKIIYSCTDSGFETMFDKLVFCIEKIDNNQQLL